MPVGSGTRKLCCSHCRTQRWQRNESRQALDQKNWSADKMAFMEGIIRFQQDKHREMDWGRTPSGSFRKATISPGQDRPTADQDVCTVAWAVPKRGAWCPGFSDLRDGIDTLLRPSNDQLLIKKIISVYTHTDRCGPRYTGRAVSYPYCQGGTQGARRYALICVIHCLCL